MPDIRDYVITQISPYKKYILGGVILVIFIALAVYMYMTYGKTLMNKKKFVDVANESPSQQPLEIMIFTVDWCPHCQKAEPEWTIFSDKYDGKIVNGYQIKCIKYDCTDSKDPEVSNLTKNYKIDSYPTVILFKGNDRYDFDANVKANALGQFVETVASQN